MSVRVFLSYRRDDSRHLAGRLRDRLVDAFGADNVFFDVDSIPFGQDFRRVIGDRIATVDVVLALIGPRYSPEQLAKANDMVRMELITAFEQGKLVVPVLLEGAAMPPADALPDDLERLAYLHAAPLRPDPDFHPDARRLIDNLSTTVAALGAQPPVPDVPPPAPAPAPVEPPVAPGSEPASAFDSSVTPWRWTLVDVKGGGPTRGIAFSGDGRFVAAGGDGGVLRVWAVATGDLVRSLPDEQQRRISALAWSPTADLVAGVGGSRFLRVWDAAGDFVVKEVAGLVGEVTSLAWSPGGGHVVTGGMDGAVRMFDLTGEGSLAGTFRAHAGGVRSVAWSPDGRLVASGGWKDDPTVRLWNPDGAAVRTLRGHTKPVTGLAFTPDGSQLVSASDDRTVRTWDVAGGEQVARLDGPTGFWSVAVSPDGLLIAAGDYKGVRVWERATRRRAWTLPRLPVTVNDVAFSPDGRFLASAGGIAIVRTRTLVVLWELAG